MPSFDSSCCTKDLLLYSSVFCHSATSIRKAGDPSSRQCKSFQSRVPGGLVPASVPMNIFLKFCLVASELCVPPVVTFYISDSAVSYTSLFVLPDCLLSSNSSCIFLIIFSIKKCNLIISPSVRVQLSESRSRNTSENKLIKSVTGRNA